MNIQRNVTIESGKLFDTATKLVNKFFDKLDDFLTDDVENEVKDHISKSEDGQYNLVIDTNDAMEFELQLSALKELIFDVRVSNSGKEDDDGIQLFNISVKYNSNKSNARKLNDYLDDEETGPVFKELLEDLKSKNSVTATDVEVPKSENEDEVTEYIMSAISSILESYIGDVWGKITEINKANLNHKGTSTAASAKITLQKVLCDTGYDINLVSVGDLDDPLSVPKMIDDLCSDDDFVDSIPVGDPIPYEVQYTDDELDVCPCDPYDLNKCIMYNAILQHTYQLFADLYYIDWNVTGVDRDSTMSIINQFRWTLSDMISEVSRMYKVDCGYAPHPSKFLSGISSSIESMLESSTDVSQVTCIRDYIKEEINCIVSLLELYYPNFSTADAGYVTSCLRTFKYSCKYFFGD